MTDLHDVAERPKGVVDPLAFRQRVRLNRYQPSAALAGVLDHHWIVEWDLHGQPPFTQRTLPYPCVNVVFDRRQTGIFGVVSGAFETTLAEAGRVIGLRFRPGAFRAFFGKPLQLLTDKVLPVSTLLDCDDVQAEEIVLSAQDDAGMVAAAETLLLRVLPPPDPQVERIHTILQMLQQDASLTQVRDLAERAALSERTLQQMFSEYVGVTPKWVIRRYRLHEAADQLANGAAVDLAELAHALGYFDQAHFTRDFRRLVGKAPAEYRRTNQP
ncbi:helix-turn-helix domain-containing protein [Ralstonia insidiosa]|uniref:AraC family transcriptional regulator n=1 Tax=Ralstonia TaxID=48736 RepID=UPI000664AF4B|nr:helix-turn-helix domain-containing protein [Ralstonia insidiosa]KMW46658.1 AraC family transcriptional regulator [Ralstonia sp. MD27]MBX3771677.1 helix-turn-helix domain-containing protein [Ralstonia pickettii]NOZ15396.1 AraC family transcriptional regulator [Betaproteobacteria bacterium]MBA9855776.1 AraC family transcriptional regulator [Ralstonia insidiosa]MBA9868719.1 AraC family transcriptional regulator [Ralstonia insidiosa]